jgi:hypothetical protein
MPPPSVAELSKTALALRVMIEPAELPIPLPLSVAELFEMLLARTDSVPPLVLSMPPPMDRGVVSDGHGDECELRLIEDAAAAASSVEPSVPATQSCAHRA